MGGLRTGGRAYCSSLPFSTSSALINPSCVVNTNTCQDRSHHDGVSVARQRHTPDDTGKCDADLRLKISEEAPVAKIGAACHRDRHSAPLHRHQRVMRHVCVSRAGSLSPSACSTGGLPTWLSSCSNHMPLPWKVQPGLS